MADKHYRTLSLYVLSVFLVGASNFATAPLLLAQIGPENYAVWAALEPILLLAIPLAGLGLNYGYMNAHGSDPGVAGQLLPAHALFVCVMAALSTLVLLAFGVAQSAAILAGLIVLFEGTIVFFIAFWRSNSQPLQLAAFEGGRAFVVVLCIAGCLAAGFAFPSDATGYLVIRAVISGMAAVIGFRALRWKLAPNWAAARRGIRYGLPVVIAAASVVIIMNFDRYGVSLSAGALALTAYVAHVKVVQILGSALVPFFTWFAPLAIARLKSGEDHALFYRSSFLYFVCVNLSLSLGLWIITPLLWASLFPSLEFDLMLFAVLLVGTTVFACGNPVSIGTLIEGRTHRSLIFTGVATVVGFAVMVLLAPLYGALGVAIAKFIAMASYTFLFARDTQRAVGLQYNWAPVAALSTICAAIAVLATAWEPDSQLAAFGAAFVLPGIFLVTSLAAVHFLARRGS